MKHESILVVIGYLPFPVDHGDAIRMDMMLSALSRMFKVTAVVVRREDTTVDHVRSLVERHPEVRFTVVEQCWLGRSDSLVRKGVRLLWGTLRGRPSLFYPRTGVGVEGLVRRLSQSHAITLAVGEASGYALLASRSPRRIWDKANVFTAFAMSEISSGESAWYRLKYRVFASVSRRYEARVLRRCTGVLVTSPEEKQRLADVLGYTGSSVVPSAITDLPERLPDRTYPTKVTTVGWLSTFGYAPNWEGLQRFVREVDGTARDASITLAVAGKGATDAQREWLSRYDWIHLEGFVESLDGFMGSLDGAVVPIWRGAGVKLKTLTFLSHGVPVAATPLAMEGISQAAALATSDSPNAMLSALLTSTPIERESVSARAWQELREQFTLSAFHRQLREALMP